MGWGIQWYMGGIGTKKYIITGIIDSFTYVSAAFQYIHVNYYYCNRLQPVARCIWYNIIYMTRRVWRYQKGNQNPYIEEERRQHNGQKDKQLSSISTKHTHKTKDRVTRTPLKTGGKLRCSGRVSSSCSTSSTHSVNLVTKPVINFVIDLQSVHGLLNNKI